jgi:hypothetical protein
VPYTGNTGNLSQVQGRGRPPPLTPRPRGTLPVGARRIQLMDRFALNSCCRGKRKHQLRDYVELNTYAERSDRLILLCLYDLGCRVGELVTTRVSDIDFQNGLPSPRPLHPLISPKPSHPNHGNRTPARRLPAPRDALACLSPPEEMLEPQALNGNPHLQQFRILLLTGILRGYNPYELLIEVGSKQIIVFKSSIWCIEILS